MLETYRPSGRVNSSSFIYFLLLSLIALPVLGLIYAYLIWYIPFFYLNLFIAAGFAFGVGLLVNIFVIGKGKVRNKSIAIVFGLAATLLAMYFHWAVWLGLVLNAGESIGGETIGITVSNIKLVQVFYLIADPEALFSLMGTVYEYGTWGFKGSTVSGIFLGIIWSIEFLIVAVISVFTSMGQAEKPFCEASDTWFEEMELSAFSFIGNTEEFISSLMSSNLEYFKNLEKAQNLEESHSVFSIFISDNAPTTYFSVENKLASKNDKGEVEFDENYVVEYAAIPAELKTLLIEK